MKRTPNEANANSAHRSLWFIYPSSVKIATSEPVRKTITVQQTLLSLETLTITNMENVVQAHELNPKN